MIDESTDTSALSQLVIVAKYLLPSGDAETSFVHMCDIANGKVETIEGAAMAYIQNFDLNVSKLRAFGSDSSSVMVGKNNGVAAKLKIHQPRLLSIHCINHRLAFAAAHADDDIPILQKFKSTVQSLFLFYQNSPVRMAGLHLIQEVFNDPIIKLTQAKDFRWLSHDAAINSIICTLPSLIASLEREATVQSALNQQLKV